MVFLSIFLALAAPAGAAPQAPRPVIPLLLNAPVPKIADWSELRGKVVYVEFWATWCAPCVAGMPRTNRLIDALKDVPVVFLAVSDEAPEIVRAFLKTHEMKAWVGVDEKGAAFQAFHVEARPDGYLIGKDGTLLARIEPDQLKESDVRDAAAGRLAPRAAARPSPPRPSPAAAKSLIAVRVAAASGEPGMSENPYELTGRALPFRSAVAAIWDVQPDQVLVDSAPVAAFDFELRAPEVGVAAGRPALQRAVEAAFGVRAAPERREADAFVLRLSTAPGAPRPKPGAADARSGLMAYGGGRLLGKVALSEVARALWVSLAAPVFDETGLPGEYAFDLEWPFGDRAALERLLAAQGLVLVPARRSVDCVRFSPAKP